MNSNTNQRPEPDSIEIEKAQNGISAPEIDDYHENGYHIIRGVITAKETEEYRRLVGIYVKTDAYETKPKYPEPAKYTVRGNTMAKPGLASIVEHPTVVNSVECLLGERSHLTAYVAYVRTPGNRGGGAHCDYKRWRPVGSSMNWLFAIIPLTDFDLTFGPLLVSPGSHKLAELIDPQAAIRDLTAPDRDKLPPFIDPDLKAGDLLLMNGHTWHLPPPGTATEDRSGFFLKYCAVNAPPATGYYPYSNAAYNSMSDAGKRLIPIHFDDPIKSARLLIEGPTPDEPSFLLMRDKDSDSWELPGGKSEEEEEAVGWDIGSRIGALQSIVEGQLNVPAIPWMSYIDDRQSADGVCRFYGYRDSNGSLESAVENFDQCAWFTALKLRQVLGENHEINQIVRSWQRNDIIRGKGKAGRQMKQQFDSFLPHNTHK